MGSGRWGGPTPAEDLSRGAKETANNPISFQFIRSILSILSKNSPSRLP